MNISVVYSHVLFDKSEPGRIRIKSIAKEFVRKAHKLKLGYSPFKKWNGYFCVIDRFLMER